jgi:hypothetical protein
MIRSITLALALVGFATSAHAVKTTGGKTKPITTMPTIEGAVVAQTLAFMKNSHPEIKFKKKDIVYKANKSETRGTISIYGAGTVRLGKNGKIVKGKILLYRDDFQVKPGVGLVMGDFKHFVR